MKKSLIYSFLAFIMCGVSVSFATQTNAFNISELNISWDWVRAFWQAYWNLNNNSVSTCSWNSECNLSYQILYDDMCYIWAWNWKYYTPTTSNYYTVINTSACQSPTTIWGYYYWGWSRDPRAEFSIQLDYWSYTMFVPWVSFANNWEGIDFGYIRWSQWKVVYSVPSRVWFVVDYWENSYTITKVFVYPNRFIFSTSDGSFMFEVGAGWTVANGFFVIDPSAVSNNLYFVDSVKQKAWSTTISSDLAWDLLLWNKSYWSVFNDWNFWNIFTTSYTLTTVAWWSIFPSGFGPWYQDTSFGFSYQEDLEFVSPWSWSWNNSWSTWWNSNIQQEYLTCVWKYWYVSQLSLALQNLKNWIGVDYDYTWYLYQYEWAASFDWSYTWLDVQINNIVLDKTFVSSVNHVWEISQESPHTYVYYFNQAVSNIANPSNIISIYCWENPLSNASDMLYYDDPFGSNELNPDYTWNIDDCDWYDVLCNMEIWKNKNDLLDSTLWEIWWYINILFGKIASPVIDSFNEWSNSTIWNRLQCWNYTTIPVIDYIQYLLLFFIFIFFIKLL